MPTTYEQDFLLWTEEQAEHLLNRNLDADANRETPEQHS